MESQVNLPNPLVTKLQTMYLATEEAEAQARQLSLEVARAADEMVITDQASNGAVANFMLAVKVAAKRLADHFQPEIARAYAHHRDMVARSKEIIRPLSEAECNLKRKLSDWDLRERQRAEAEARVRAEAARKAEEDARLAAAIEAEQAGEPEVAEEILSAPVVPITVATPVPPPIQGVSHGERWLHRVVDETLIPRDFLCVDNSKLAAYARTMKVQARVPGVEFYREQTVTARTPRSPRRIAGGQHA